jgi:beta-glucosidase
VMGAYNRTNGEACCAHTELLQRILREEWGFDGYVVSDCGAIEDFHARHTVTATPAQSAALAVKKGCDLECGSVYPALSEALAEGLVSEADIERAVSRLMRARFLLGMFDPEERVPYARIPYEIVDSPEHQALALEAAQASLVLLKNTGGLLPLQRDLGCIAVVGPNADDREVLVGNYAGVPSRPVTVLDGIRQAVSPATRVLYAPGCDLVSGGDSAWGERGDDGFAEALAAADRADVTVLVLGISNRIEGEEGGASLAQWGGDRIRIDLPTIQRRLFDAVAGLGRPLVLVLLTGSPLAISGEHERAGAVLLAWYPGQAGGTAVADVLFGSVSPSGRLPVTFVRSVEQLPPFTDYAMTGRTYRFMENEPLYPFGYGLGYSRFAYSGLKVPGAVASGEKLELSVEIRNTGSMGAAEIAQVYLSDLEASVRVPRWQLAGFARVFLEPGAARTVRFTVSARQMAVVDERGRHVVEPGRFRLHVGGRQPDPRSAALAGTVVLQAEFEARGKPVELPW